MRRYVCILLGCAVAVCLFKINYDLNKKGEMSNWALVNLEALAFNEGGDQGESCYSEKFTVEEAVGDSHSEVKTKKCSTYSCVHGKGNYCMSGSECTFYDGNGKEKSYSNSVTQLVC